MFGIGLIGTLLESLILSVISLMIFSIALPILVKVSGGELPPRKWGLQCIAILFFVILVGKFNSFYLVRGGIDYRRVPITSSLEIRETEMGTYLMSKGRIVDTVCDLDSFEVFEQEIVYRCKNSDNVFGYNFERGKAIYQEKNSGMYLKNFDDQYFRYHFLLVNPIIVLCTVIILIFCFFFRLLKRGYLKK